MDQSFRNTKLLNLEAPLYNLDVLKATTEEDTEFLIKILTTFLENNQELLTKMKSALKNKNFIDVGNFAHKMLSSYKHLEVNLLIDPLTKLETLSVGHQIESDKIQEMIDFLDLHSKELFEQISKEIELVKN